MVTCIEHIALKRPVVLVLSDLHWADDLVLQLVDTLLERLAGQPFVVLATARRSIEERWHPPHGGRHNLVVLTLDPLTPDSARSLLRELAGVDEIGRAHVCTPVTTAHLVCRLLLKQKKTQ